MTSRLSLRARAAVAALALVPAGLFALGSGGAGAAGAAAPRAAQPAKPGAEIFGDFYPANPVTQLLKQPDGTAFAAKLTHGEIGGTFETESGHTVVRGEDRVWRYATGRDAKGELVASAIAVKPGFAPTGIKPRVGRTSNIWDDGYGGDIRSQAFRSLQIASRKAQEKARAAGEPRLFKFPALMLATWWDESKGQNQPQFQDGSNTPEFFKKILDGFGGNPQGTLTEFYFEDSFGQFLVQVDVFGPFTSQRSREDRCYYGGIGAGEDDGDLDFLDENLGVGGGGAIGMALESVPQADATVDFSQYDNDNDGEVDFTAIIHSGPDMAVTGDACHTWSHATGVNLGGPLVEETLGLPPGTVKAGLQTSDTNTRMTPPTPVQVNRVFTMPEFSSETSPLTIGVATHEMSHALGEPDYYDTTSQSAGTGDWDIMAGGSYLGNPAGSNPSLHNPASRVYQGYITPTVVNEPLRNVTLKPRNQLPFPGYTADQPDPNLLLVPVYEISVGEEDARGHVWTERDVEGVPKNPKTGKYVIEGYYLENINRMWHSPPEYENFSRGGYFDRKVHQSGLMVWHYDYYLRSNVRHNSNNAQSFSNRPQMDPMEFDRNDNTQELQLNLSRGNVGDLVVGAAAGISSGTRKLQPGLGDLPTGEPQAAIPFTGVNAPTQSSDFNFTVEDNPNNYSMTVAANADGTPPGDCTLQLLYDGEPVGDSVDGGFIGQEEVITVSKPKPGPWTARVGDFAACINYSGKVTFNNAASELPTKGAADTWSHWSTDPTGWAFTNVGPKDVDGIAMSTDAVGSPNITLDVMRYGTGDVDVSPGFAQGAPNERGGFGSVNAGQANAMSVPVVNHGGKAVSNVGVTVRRDSANGPVVAQKTVSLGGYDRKDVAFTYTPSQEGWFDLYVSVDDPRRVSEGNEDNNVQKSTGWAGPAGARVLVVDDDGELTSERATQGALAALGVPYATVTEHPTAEQLKKYEAVIWEAGVDRNQGQLDKGDRAALKSYLDAGGNVFIQSNRIASALGNSSGDNADAVDFLKNYLGSTLGGSDDTISREVVSQISGTGGVFGNVKGEIVPFAARPFIETLVPATEDVFGTVKPALTVNGTEENHFLGVSVAGDSAHKGFKTVTVGYNFAQHTTADTSVGMLRSALTFFGVEMGTYEVSTKEPVVYHSTVRDQVSGRKTPITAVVLGGKPGAPVSLHYRRHNRGGFYEQKMAAGSENGVFAGEIPRFAATPDGIDYYLKAGTATTYEPRGVADATLTYAIGVQLPEISDALDVLPGGLKPVTKPQGPRDPQGPPPEKPAGPGRQPIASTGLADVLPVLALVLLGSAVVVRRRSRAAA